METFRVFSRSSVWSFHTRHYNVDPEAVKLIWLEFGTCRKKYLVVFAFILVFTLVFAFVKGILWGFDPWFLDLSVDCIFDRLILLAVPESISIFRKLNHQVRHTDCRVDKHEENIETISSFRHFNWCLPMFCLLNCGR